MINPVDLAKRCSENNDTLEVRLDGVSVLLKRGEHFWLNNKDRNSL
jgi:hypothetical protein